MPHMPTMLVVRLFFEHFLTCSHFLWLTPFDLRIFGQLHGLNMFGPTQYLLVHHQFLLSICAWLGVSPIFGQTKNTDTCIITRRIYNYIPYINCVSTYIYIYVQIGRALLTCRWRQIFIMCHSVGYPIISPVVFMLVPWGPCVVYGSLPPEVRQEQAALFNDPNSSWDVPSGNLT